MRLFADELERGVLFEGSLVAPLLRPAARALERAWARASAARLVKPLRWPDGARVVAIGGATLGGSGKTPLAMACAREIESQGLRAAIVGHAYRATPAAPRVVCPDDPLEAVGDEARMCARAGLRVTVGATRQQALDLALGVADVAILDGVPQCAPRRATLALLAVDPAAPWGAGACPPCGDLRAPRAALEAAADLVVPVRACSRGAWRAAALVPWADLVRLRIGLVTAVARPRRVADLLLSHGVVARATRTFPDHARARIPRVAGIDLWLTTAKCAASMAPASNLAVIDHQPLLEPSVRVRLRELLDPAPAGSYPRKDR